MEIINWDAKEYKILIKINFGYFLKNPRICIHICYMIEFCYYISTRDTLK